MNCINPNCPRIHRHTLEKTKSKNLETFDNCEQSNDDLKIDKNISYEIPKFIHSTYLYSNNICKFYLMG
jgi:hypothetical protein